MKKKCFLGLLVLVLVLVIGFIGCGGDDDEKYNCTLCNDNVCGVCQPPQHDPATCADDNCTTCHTFTGAIDLTDYANLNGSVSLSYPAGFTAKRKAAIETKFVVAFDGLEDRAANNETFKGQINPILARGLTINIEETNAYEIKVTGDNRHVLVATAYVENPTTEGSGLSTDIRNLIRDGDLIP